MSTRTTTAPEWPGRPASGLWRRALPVLSDGRVTLRGLSASDAVSLATHLTSAAVTEHLTMGPASAAEFHQFIRWSQARRRRGTLACFAVLAPGSAEAIGIVQAWGVGGGFSSAEWGIAIGEAHWGRGIGAAAARLLIDFTFGMLQARRVEARVTPANHRAAALLHRLGAVREGTLRRAFSRGDRVDDYEMWAILSNEWSPEDKVLGSAADSTDRRKLRPPA